jgi:hypothetical protein
VLPSAGVSCYLHKPIDSPGLSYNAGYDKAPMNRETQIEPASRSLERCVSIADEDLEQGPQTHA